jgi:hypothetical protein
VRHQHIVLAREFADREAPEHVVAALRWLEHAGHTSVDGYCWAAGGHAGLTYADGTDGAVVWIECDRGAWGIELSAAPGAPRHGLTIVLGAHIERYRRIFLPEDQDAILGPLPLDVRWHESLPGALEWLVRPGSEAVIEDFHREWQRERRLAERRREARERRARDRAAKERGATPA